eukprot:3740728-Rhodomonas_salina.2
MGLRVRDVVVTTGSHVTLFIRKQNNDPYSRCSGVVLAWISGSGIPIGDCMVQLLARLHPSRLGGGGPGTVATYLRVAPYVISQASYADSDHAGDPDTRRSVT